MKLTYCVLLGAFVLPFISTTSSANTSLPIGENLIQPLPLPEDSWTEYEKKEGKTYIRKWVRDNGANQMLTAIFNGDKASNISQTKEIDSKTGKKNCNEFRETEIKNGEENGYPTISWLSSCKLKGGKTISVLHKVISGKDSSYHLRRIWTKGYSDEALSAWKTYWSSVYVCDTRSETNACPDGFQKAQ